MKESRQEHLQKANRSALKGSRESAINGMQKDSAQEEIHVVSATMRTNVENQRAHPLLLQNRRRKSEGMSLRGRSPSGKRSRRPCKDYISGKCTNPSCDSWHPPVCQNFKTHSGCKFGESWSECTERLKVSLTKDRKRMPTKVLLLC